MDGTKMARLLALALFVSCGVSAFCLGMLAFTLSTGDLPFGLTPIMKEREHKGAKAKERLAAGKTKEGPGAEARISEQYLNGLYEDIIKEKEKIAAERDKLVQEKTAANDILDQAKKMQAKVEETEASVGKLLKTIDSKEISNMKILSELISGLEPAQASKLLMELDEKIASRLLYMMNKKTASLILSDLVKNSKDDKQMAKIKKLSMDIQVLTDAKSLETGGTKEGTNK